jgi:hypothetical protein
MHGTISTLENDEILKQLASMNRLNVQNYYGYVDPVIQNYVDQAVDAPRRYSRRF